MADAGDFTLDLRALEEQLTRAMRECPRDVFRELKAAGGDFLDSWVGKAIKSGRFGPGGDRLRARTGTLRRAFDSTASGADLDSLRFSAGTIRQGVPYAWIQEYGGEIRPKRTKFLTIPLEAALTAAGVLRQPARQWPDTFVRMRPGGGGGVIFQKRPGGGLVALFALVKRVRIAGRLGFFDSWKRNEPGFLRYLGEAVARALQRNSERRD